MTVEVEVLGVGLGDKLGLDRQVPRVSCGRGHFVAIGIGNEISPLTLNQWVSLVAPAPVNHFNTN